MNAVHKHPECVNSSTVQKFLTWKPPTQRAIAAVCCATGLSKPELLAHLRFQERVDARHLTMWLARERGAGIAVIARAMERDHSSVVYGLKQAKKKIASDPHFAMLARQLLAGLEGQP